MFYFSFDSIIAYGSINKRGDRQEKGSHKCKLKGPWVHAVEIAKPSVDSYPCYMSNLKD